MRFAHFGEGEYEPDRDRSCVLLLGVAKDAPKAGDPKSQKRNPAPLQSRPRRTSAPNAATRKPGPEVGHAVVSRRRRPERNRFALDGDWLVADEYVESTDATSMLDLRYHAGEVNLVLDRTTRTRRAGGDRARRQAGPEERLGTSIVELRRPDHHRVDAADLYDLIEDGPNGRPHAARAARGAGVQRVRVHVRC